MLISTIINDSFDLLSRQLKFYCWHYKRDLDQRQQQELIALLNENYFEKLANKIRSLLDSNIADCKQQVAKLLFEQCLTGDRRHQLIQLIESNLVDIDVRLDNYGRTLLHRTAYNLDVELVKSLIDHGVNIRLRDYAGNTALHIAIQSYRNGALIYNNETAVIQNLTQIIQLLLEADKNLQRLNGPIGNETRLMHDVKSDSCSKPHAHPSSKLGESNDGSDLTKESLVATNTLNTKLTDDNEPSQNRDVTLCRMLGSHCICNTKTNIDSINQLHSIKSINNAKTSEPSTQNGTKLGDLAFSDKVSMPLVDIKNAFGRTALHYCVLVVGEQHLDKFVKLLIDYGAEPDVIDTRLKTPLYCLVKRPGVAAIRQKCRAITYLLESGCDDLGLAITTRTYFTENLIKNLETNISSVLLRPSDDDVEPIFSRNSFKRVPTLKHLARLKLIKMNDELNGKLCRQMSFRLPDHAPQSLNTYINRKVLDQTELF
jgi:ankyrin repeat protein